MALPLAITHQSFFIFIQIGFGFPRATNGGSAPGGSARTVASGSEVAELESIAPYSKTILWYLQNKDWWEAILSGQYRLERLGNFR
ncbi:MAG: hypothetical protein ACPGSB_08735 [Opitutales bacterium]